VAFELAPFHEINLDDAFLQLLIDEHESRIVPRYERLWSYYRNALAEPDSAGGSSGPPAQAVGLPRRLTNVRLRRDDDRHVREIVVENDIAWRINTLVDFMFPTEPRLISTARDQNKRAEIEALLNAIINANGGIAMWQNGALLGAIYGHVDFLINIAASDNSTSPTRRNRSDGATSKPDIDGLIERISNLVTIETIEAPRAIPLLNANDYRQLDGYIVHFHQPVNDIDHGGLLARLSRSMTRRRASSTQRRTVTVTEIYSPTHWQRYEDGRLVAEQRNRLGRLPIVHVQNLAQPLQYEGLSEVEPLIPLQDELNTRLSDRANRVTMQSFRMYLGKGIEDFTDHPIGPGQMWVTDNPEASIEAFGGDADSPSEQAHLEQLREALDKTSGVTPAAAGHIKARVGNLTSENALRISLMGTIAKTKRKRITYGAGIEALSDLILHALDVHGLYHTDPSDRGIDIAWSDAIPVDESRRIQDALAKAELGVPKDVLRRELGYAGTGD